MDVQNNLEKSLTIKIGDMFFEDIQCLYHGEDCMKRFCSTVREHAINVIHLERKKMLSWTRAKIAPSAMF